VEAADSEERLAQLCRWVLSAHDQQLEYGLILPSSTVQPATGTAHRLRCLTTLACFGQEDS